MKETDISVYVCDRDRDFILSDVNEFLVWKK